MRYKREIKRIISCLLVLCMMVQLIPQSAIQVGAADDVTEINLNTAAVTNIYLLTNNQFVDSDQGVTTSKGVYRLTDDGSNNVSRNVYIGDTTYSNTDYKGTNDIKVELQAVKSSLGLLQINAISDGQNKADLTVSEASKIGTLKIEKNAKTKITMNADLEIAEISTAEESSLEIDTNGHNLKVTGAVTGSGDITFKGGNVTLSDDLKAASLTLDSTTVDANDKSIAVTDRMTIKSSTVQKANLLGYADDATGNKTLAFGGSGNKLTDIKAVGTSEEGKVVVTITGQNTITSASNTTYYCDYSIKYQYNDEYLDAQNTWPASYRVKLQGTMSDSNSSIVGYHTESGSYKTVSGEVILPEYEIDGYSYVGWKTEKGEDAITKLSGNTKGDQTLTAVLNSDKVAVSLDLGYEPDETTNDDYQNLKKETTQNKEWGETVSLTKPTRFGYQFKGWKVTSVNDGKTYSTESEYNVALSDAKKDEGTGAYQITLEAQWEAKQFPFRFQISSGVAPENIKVTVGDKTYDSIQDFADTYKVKWDSTYSLLEFGDITYGERLEKYLKNKNIEEIPQLVDKRTGDSKFAFSGWATANGKIVTKDMTFTMGSLLDTKEQSETLEAYEESITKIPTLLTSQWGTASYTLTTDIVDGWDILVDGVVQDPSTMTKSNNPVTGNDTMTITVKAGSEVTYRCSASDVKNFSLWNFTEGFTPEEIKMTSGTNYVSYTAKMPYNDVTAYMSDAQKIYIDISQSSVTFEENVTLPSGRTADGFWYNKKMTMANSESDDMIINALTPAFQETSENSEHKDEYFYVWNMKDEFHLTSKGVETTNQFSLVNAMTVSLKNCKMKATDTYNTGAVGSKLGNVDIGDVFAQDRGKATGDNLKDVDLKQYANILLNTQKTNAYKVTLNIEDNKSEIMDISTDGFHSGNQYNGQVILQGNNNKLKLGTFFGDFQLQMNKLDVTSYEKSDSYKPFDYAIYAANEGNYNITLQNSKVDVKKHNIFTFNRRVTIENTNLKVNNIKAYYEGVLISGTSNVHIYGDIYSGRHTIGMSGSSNTVIDGNVISTAQDNYSSGTINTSGYLIVKGTVFDTGNMTLKKGTVICNILEVGSKIEITDSNKVRIITNMITGNIHNRLDKDTDGKYVLANGTRRIDSVEHVSKNEDDYPFITYSSNAQTAKVYKFGGSNANIYLYGYYKTTTGNYYDTTVTATDEENPVNQWIEKCVDNDGELNSSISLGDSDIESSIKGYKDTENKECIVLGNSTYTSQTEMPRQASFEGSKIYAAGNITMFNDTTVSGGQISCNGDFGTKGDLSITGGTLDAKTVGNVGSLTTSKEDTTKCWKKVSISGGTVNADMIGARNSYASGNYEQRSYVDITEGTIKDSTEIRSDEYVNYIYSKEDFQDSNNEGVSLQDNLRMTNEWKNGSLGSWTTDGISTIPKLKDNNNEEGNWVYGSISGPKVTGIDTNGKILPATDSEQHAYDSDQILLYAVRSKSMLTKVYGSEYYGISVDGDSNAGFSQTQMTDISDQKSIDVSQTEIQGGASVTLTLTNEKYKDRTVVWYKDGNGQYHNALADSKWDEKSITFLMPNGNTYIYVVDEKHQLPLDFKASSLSFTKDGFITEYAQVDSDGSFSAKSNENVFTYAGDYKIVQSDIKDGDITEKSNNNKDLTCKNETSNRLHFAKDFMNTEDENSQNIYIHHVFQKYEDSGFGVVLEDGANVKFQIDGKNGLFRFSVKENSKLVLKGKTGQDKDYIYFNKSTTNTPDYYNTIIGNNDSNGKTKATGKCIIEDLNLVMRSNYGGTLMRGGENSSDRSGSLMIKDCIFDRKVWGDSNYIAKNLKEITIDHSTFNIPNTSDGYTTAMFRDCGDVTIQNESELSWTQLGSISTGGFSVDFGIDNNFTIDNSKVVVNYDERHTAGNYQLNEYSQMKAKNVILKNNANFQIDSRALFNHLEVNNGSELKVSQKYKEDTYLFSSDITVNGGTIDTDYLIVSGYYLPLHETGSINYAASKTDLDNRIKNKTSMVDGNDHEGLVIKSGTVNAKKFAGGDTNGKISVEGGTLNAAQIGTSGNLYGFTRPLPANTTDYVYQYPILNYSNYTEKAKVEISGGTVSVKDNGYLGGMNSEVELKGGEVVLGDQAVIGMTKDQTITLKDHYSSKGDDIAAYTSENCNVTINGGSVSEAENAKGQISAPYGKIDISNTKTKVKVTNMNSDYGTIHMEEANDGYDNPYEGGETGTYRKNKIGIWITDTLSAQTLEIANGAQVYATNAYAEITDNKGVLSVQKAALYSTSYGEKGIVRKNEDKKYNDTPNATDQTVFGTKMVTITYDLNPQGVMLDSDVSEVKNENETNYTVTATETTITLKDLACDGYEFKGWYNNKECTGDRVISLDTTIPNDLTLYAKWEKVKVKFQIMMDQSSSSDVNESEFDNNDNWEKISEGTYVYKNNPEVTYADNILSVSGVNLKDYSTNTLGVTELEIFETNYTGAKFINASTIVTKELAKYYKDKNQPIVLHVKGVQKRYATITFSLNQKDEKPSDAQFPNSVGVAASMERQENVGVDKKLGSVDKFADKDVTDGNSKGLIRPTATGYTFVGWNTNAEATKDTTDGWVDADKTFSNSTTVYAIWQANTYLIEFNAGEGSWVTSENSEPEVGTEETKTLNYYWKYDTPVSEKNSFWIKESGTDKYMTELPYAWKEGSTFNNEDGWYYTYTENGQQEKKQVSSTEVLNEVFIKALKDSYGDPNGKPEQVALKLTAEYTPVKVSYDLNDGTWKNSKAANETNPKYGDALYGYTKDSAVDGENEVTSVKGDNQTKYSVISTTANYFNEYQGYTDHDYRKDLSRKGYTFKGWKDEKGEYVGTTPRFHDVSLTAEWEANKYSLTLNSLKDGYSQYSKFNADTPESPVTGIDVTVGEEIEDYESKWPNRNGGWYAYNSNHNASSLQDNQKRYLLGFTFDKLDPGTTDSSDDEGNKVYKNYAETVTNLQNINSLYQNKVNKTAGTVFELPEDSTYTKAIVGSSGSTVPDYPAGSTIQMYAVYRERSLVFVERYIDPDGNLQQQIKYSGDWNTWSNYPEEYDKKDKLDVTKQGYSLIGWYVNGTTASAKSYPKNQTDYENAKQGFKDAAESIGTYDIMVYTVYAAQVTRPQITLTANEDPVSTDLSTDTYTLPSSMQSGILSLQLTSKDNNLNLVSKEEMDEHAYDQSWTKDGKTYNSDDTVAVVAAISNGTTTKTKDLSEIIDGEDKESFEQEVGAGWQLTFTLYHSKVMTKESAYNLKVKAKFSSSQTDLSDQWIMNEIQVKLQPSIYKVKYKINLPEAAKNLSINTEGTDFAKPTEEEKEITKEVSLAYGSKLSDKLPEIEGYIATPSNGWKYGTSDDKAYSELTMKVDAGNNGVIDLTKDYEANTYNLSADDQTLNDWKITYSNGVSDTSSTELTNAGKAVKYHSLITFTQKDTANPPEFVTLTLGSGDKAKKVKLSDYATKDGDSYTFAMPACAVEASYVTEETMYLEEGTIKITKNGYTQEKSTGEVNKNWTGNYVILQNKDNSGVNATENRLIINGDLSGHNINIGNLNISSTDSIELGKDTTANIVMTYQNQISGLTAKNIKVPKTSALTCKPEQDNSGDVKNAVVALNPDKSDAAIGDVSGNGSITLKHLELTTKMPAGSTASAIGSEKESPEAGEKITLTNSNLTVEEGSDTNTYKGVWLGGDSVTEVSLDKVKVNCGNDFKMTGPMITNADVVNITNSEIGTSGTQIKDPIYAKNNLNIESCSIYQDIQTNITENSEGTAPIGTSDGGMTTVTDSTINSTRTGELSKITDLYTGSLYIKDAKSDVTINGHQIIELSNGSVEIKTTEYQQDTVNHEAKPERTMYCWKKVYRNLQLLI